MSDFDPLWEAIEIAWPDEPTTKAFRYVGMFDQRTRTETVIRAKVKGNHGVYTVSIELDEDRLEAACSCYIGGSGGCHHCDALGFTFLDNPQTFCQIRHRTIDEVSTLLQLRTYLQGVKLDALVKELRRHGITQKALAESIGMSTRHLSAVKSAELKNRFYHELGATKLACLWVLEHIADDES